MESGFSNVYDDAERADSYSRLEFPGTYYLAYRDLPAIIAEHVQGKKALDFGCGTGRSTRFLSGLGFEVTGVDIAEPMLARAREFDPRGDYRLLPDGDLGGLTSDSYDLALSVFTFDNIPRPDQKIGLFHSLGQLLKQDGRIVSLVSSPELYLNEWASFSTRDFPENRKAGRGDTVRLIMLDVKDRRPVEDILWPEDAYRDVYQRAGLTPIQIYRPLGLTSEPYPWVSETGTAPWTIYVLGRAGADIGA